MFGSKFGYLLCLLASVLIVAVHYSQLTHSQDSVVRKEVPVLRKSIPPKTKIPKKNIYVAKKPLNKPKQPYNLSTQKRDNKIQPIEPKSSQLPNSTARINFESICGKVPIYEKAYRRSINEQENEIEGSRIVGGLDSTHGEWPFIVKLKLCGIGQSVCDHCTGSLLTDRWIITAAHCTVKKSIVNSTATFGLYDLVKTDKSAVSLAIDKIITHSEYKPDGLQKDLALVRLKTPITLNDFIQPVCLIVATRSVLAFARKKRCYAVGYGLVEDGFSATMLQKLPITPKNPSECNTAELGEMSPSAGSVCVGPSERKGSSCRGDSGGPNVCYDPETNKWQLFGIISYGPTNCDRLDGGADNWTTVSVDLSQFRSWVLERVRTD